MYRHCWRGWRWIGELCIKASGRKLSGEEIVDCTDPHCHRLNGEPVSLYDYL